MAFPVSQFLSFLETMVGQPYWYGTCVYKCTDKLLRSKTSQYPDHYAASRMKRYEGDIAAHKVCADCVGLIKGFFWTDGGKNVAAYIKDGTSFTNTYGLNGCPDKSANGMLTWCKSKGSKTGAMSSMPDVPGILLFKDGHVGVYVGGNYVIEAKGFNYGIQKNALNKNSWKEWAYLPSSMIDYNNKTEEQTTTETEKEMSTVAVRIGSAHIDERGKTRGGQAGDQTGGEVSAQNWYRAEKGWVMLRPKSREAGQKVAAAMKAACDNNHIGYDQGQRDTLYDAAKPYGFDPAKVTTNVETDCSALVRVCLAYAGIMVPNFNTKSEPTVLVNSDKIERYDAARYTTQSSYLRAGDILCTKTQGHTVIVLNDGPYADTKDIPTDDGSDEPVVPANPTDETDMYYTVNSYWLRAKPSLLGAKITAVKNHTLVRVYGEKDGWLGIKVMQTGEKGYISKKAIPTYNK